MSTVVRKLKAKYERCFSRLEWHTIGAADAITSYTAKKEEKNKQNRNNVFRKKETTSKVPPNIFRHFEVRKKVQLVVWTPENKMKSKCYVFNGYEQSNKVCLVYLECKLQQDSYSWCIFKLKCQKTVERTYLEIRKQQARYCRCFYMSKFLRKGKNCIIGFCQQTRNVQCMYLAFENLKISSKKSQHW